MRPGETAGPGNCPEKCPRAAVKWLTDDWGAGRVAGALSQLQAMGRRATVVPRGERDETTQNSALAPQSLPSTAFCLSSGSPQYSHFALCSTSVSVSPVWPSSPGDATAAMSSLAHTRTPKPEVAFWAPPRVREQ